MFFLTATAATVVIGRPVDAARWSSVTASGSETTSEASDLRLPDPHKELRHLSKNLKLNKDQRVGVSSILEERNREIRLLLDIESVSQEYRDHLQQK